MGSDDAVVAVPVNVCEGSNYPLASMRRTKSCLSVSTLEESLVSIDSVARSSKKKMTKQVSFHNLKIREYDIELGDNPSCRFGPPVTIGWEYSEADEILLDDLITESNEEKKTKKVLDPTQRYNMVRNAGYSDADIMKSLAGVSVIRKQRYQSVSNEKYDKINERIESISRKFKGLRKAKIDEKKNKVAPKMSRSMSLNSLSLKLPRRNSLQNLQQASSDRSPLSVSCHKKNSVSLAQIVNDTIENDVHETQSDNTSDDNIHVNSSMTSNALESDVVGVQNENIVSADIDNDEDQWGFFE